MARSGFRGGGFGGMNQMQMMKQAQTLQQEMQKMQEELDAATFSASSGGGVVTATVSGKRVLTALQINPEAVDPEDVDMLQDMVIAAVNEALRKAEEAAGENMSRLTGGLSLGF